MLRSFGLAASKLLAPDPAAVETLIATLAENGDWHADAVALLAGGWRDQVTAAAAIAIARAGDAPIVEALWTAIDGASWVAPQLVAAALIADPGFEPRAADRLGSPARRPPKTIGALVHAYTRCPARRMPVVAQLGVHDRAMATEEARIGVRGVDGWLDYFAVSSRAS
ncbi:MAG TPA: hypothetical protein VGL86_26005 [Polyangia bacterium]|jgi:hypothetical protein